MIDPTPHLERFRNYEEACRDFRWQIPNSFNFAEALFRRHPDAVTRIALYDIRFAGANIYTFGGLDYLSDKFATVLTERGVQRGDYVGICAPQSAAAAVAELATLKAGAIAVLPWSAGPGHPVEPAARLLEHRRPRNGSRLDALVLDAASLERINRAPRLVDLLSRDGPPADLIFLAGHTTQPSDYEDFWRVLTTADSDFTAVETDSASLAFVFLGDPEHDESSPEELPTGDSGAGHQRHRDPLLSHPPQPEGVPDPSAPTSTLHSHASLLSQLPGFEMANEFDLGNGKTFWTPGDWSAPSMLTGMVLPAWWYGCPVVAYDKALPTGWLEAIDACDITNAFMTESNLEFLLDARRDYLQRHGEAENNLDNERPGQTKIQRVITDRGIDAEPRRRLLELFNAPAGVVHGPPEAPCAVATCGNWFETREGWIGRAAPGWEVEVLDDVGAILAPGWLGQLVVRLSPDAQIESASSGGAPAMKHERNWLNTGEKGIKQQDGSIWLSPEQI